METTVSTKGQVVIPKAVRERHGLRPGARLHVEDHGDSIVLRPVRSQARYSIDDLLALPRPYEGPPLSVDEMQAAVDRAFADGELP